MKNIKVVTVLGTRPELIRLSQVIKKLNSTVNHILIHTGQNYDYELNEIFYEDLDIPKPDYYLDAAGNNAAETIGNTIIKIDPLLKKIKPDALLVLGDTNSCLAAIPAKKRKIPIFHMEAGNRCFDQRVPEEINRKVVDHVSDINLTYSSIAREYLLAEGFPADRVIKTGSPMYEVLSKLNTKIKESNVLKKLKIKKNEFFLVSVHREENVDNLDKLKTFIDALNEIVKIYNLPIIISTHPRTKKRIKSLKIELNKKIQLVKPLSFTDYNALQINSRAVLSDSGTITEESSILNFPALNIRDSHERPEGMEEASVMMVGFDKNKILLGLKVLQTQLRDEDRTLKLVSDYNTANVSEKVLRIIISYVNYVQKTVWKKY